MGWVNFQIWRSGEVHVAINGNDALCRFEMGTIVTGRQRVFKAYYFRVELPSGEEVQGDDRYGVRGALFALSSEMTQRGIALNVAGLRENFYESGLSFNTGQGYLKDSPHSIHMMARTPIR